jgi:hypothetical protein
MADGTLTGVESLELWATRSPWHNAACFIVDLDSEGDHWVSPLNGIIWFSLAIIGSCIVNALLTRYGQKARSLEKVSRRVEGGHSGSLTVMNVRDLLTFNLFLQFTDGLVSYQAFALGAAEANPVVPLQ